MSPPRQDAISGARESNAGDDFHVLWATRRVLGLLDPTADLAAVVMEDLHPAELAGSDPALLLGVDLTEYFGGRTIETADRVIVSQLKHSHRHPNREWTAARLAERSGRRPSVVRRLGDIFRAFSTELDREQLLRVLSLRLISNRPLGTQLERSLVIAKKWLESRPGRMPFARLKAGVDNTSRGDLGRLFKATGMKSTEFTDFLRVLELDLGQLPRAEQELAITAALSKHVNRHLEHHTRALYELVRKRADPEGFGQPIYAEDVYAKLGVHGPETLFPAPSAFTLPEQLVDTPDTERMIGALASSERRIVLAHGDAGVGKTTATLQLERYLPEGSVVIALDCFAGGDYDKPAHARHTPQRALVQLCNDLAVHCRLPLLLDAPPETPDLWRELEQRIEAAARTLASAGGQLLIVTDAIDNAVWAARRRGDPSFVPDLWNLKLAHTAGLIATARTARRDQLAVPSDVVHVALHGFDEGASATHLRHRFPDATDETCREFHERSQGNPRVQFYVLDASREEPVRTSVEAAEQAQRTPRNIFDDLWSSAVEQAEDSEWAFERLADLLCLTPPVTVEQLAKAAHVSAAKIQAFCHALTPGLRIDAEGLTLQDEDFAVYLEEKLSPPERQAAHSRLADLYATQHESDPYAAVVIAEHYRGANRPEELLKLAIEGGQPVAIGDPLARLQTYFRRIRLALRVANSEEGRLGAAKLLVLAARAATTDSAVTEVIRRKPSLALRHGDSEAVAQVWRQDRNLHWNGPVHMRLASLYAERGDGPGARAHLARAEAWNERRQEEREDWELRPEDLAHAFHAIYLLDGGAKAIEALDRWQPAWFVVAVGESLVDRIAQSEGAKRAAALVLRASLTPATKARLLLAARPRATDVPAGAVAAVARAFAKAAREKDDEREDEPPYAGRWAFRADRARSWRLDFVELAASRTGDVELAQELLEVTRPNRPRRAPDRFDGLREFREPLRWHALKAACEKRELHLDEVMPESLAGKSDNDSTYAYERDEQRRGMNEHVAPALAIYELRARATLRRLRIARIASNLVDALEKKEAGAKHRWHEPNYRYTDWVAPMCDVLIAAQGSDGDLVTRAANSAPAVSGGSDIYVWTLMARKLVTDLRYRDQALHLVGRAATAAEERPQPATELADFLLDCAEIVDSYDAELAADLYNRAVEAASGLDNAGTAALQLHAEIAPHLRGDTDAANTAARIAQAVVDYRPRVSDEEYLPWTSTLRAITELHPPSGIATMTRWEDQRLLRLWESVGSVLPAAVASGFIDAEQAIALAVLHGESRAQGASLTSLLDKLVADKGRFIVAGELDFVSLRVRRDLRSYAREQTARELIRWAAENGFERHASVHALQPYAEAQPDAYRTERPHRRSDAASGGRGGRRHRITDARQFAAALEASASDFDRDGVRRVFRYAAEECPPTKRLSLLEAISALPVDGSLMRFNTEHVLEGLREMLEQFGNSAAVRGWKTNALPNFLQDQVTNLVAYRESSRQGLGAVERLTDRTSAASLLVEAAGRHIEQLGSDGLYALAGQVARALTTEDQRALLDWSLSWLEVNDTAPHVVKEEAQSAVLAAALFSLFANPEVAVRWRAAHAARRLLCANGGDSELAAALLETTKRQEPGAYGDQELDFLRMPAQTWALMTLARAAGDRPSVTEPLAERLVATALSSEWPHIVVREFARRAALRTADLPRHVRAELTTANQPAACRVERESHYGVQGQGERGQERWHFDDDVERYLYERLGERFGESRGAIAHRAERWLIDVLGVDPDVQPLRDDRRLTHVDYGDLSTHHATRPRVESSSVALEYHGMMLAAGELVDERRPLIVEPYDDAGDPWTDWLQAHLDGTPAGWTADWRCPTPPEPALLGIELDNRHWPPITADHHAMVLGRPNPAGVVVDAYLDYTSDAGYGYDSVSSALVSPQTVSSLVRALRNAADPSFIPFPTDDDDPRAPGIDHGPFQLRGWIHESRNDRDGLEEHDPMARLRRRISLPGTTFAAHHNAETDDVPPRMRDNQRRTIAWVVAFSDNPPPQRGRDYPTDFSASGTQTYVEPRALLNFLDAVDMTLVIRVTSVRRDRRSDEKDTTHDRESHRVVVIDRHGHIEGLPGHRTVG